MSLWKLLVISTGSTTELLKIRGSFGMNESSSDNALFNFALNENHSIEDGWKLYLRKSENGNGKNWWVLLIQRYDFHGGSSGKLRIKIQVLLFHSKDKNICYIGKSYAQTLWVKMLLRLKAVFNVSLTKRCRAYFIFKQYRTTVFTEALSKDEGRSENLRQLCKPETLSSVLMRLCKHGKNPVLLL